MGTGVFEKEVKFIGGPLQNLMWGVQTPIPSKLVVLAVDESKSNILDACVYIRMDWVYVFQRSIPVQQVIRRTSDVFTCKIENIDGIDRWIPWKDFTVIKSSKI